MNDLKRLLSRGKRLMISKTKVKVSEFRKLVDAALRHASSNFHSCVNASELESWLITASSYQDKLNSIECGRANDNDRHWFNTALIDLESRSQQAKQEINDKSREAYTAYLWRTAREKRALSAGKLAFLHQ